MSTQNLRMCLSGGDRVFADTSKVSIKVRSQWMRVGTKSSKSVLIRDMKGEGDVKVETEVGLMQHEAKEH